MITKAKELNGAQQNFLDWVRIVAAMFVLLGHSFFLFDLTFLKNEEYFPLIQDIGVVVFFLLSGILISYTLEKKCASDSFNYPQFLKHKAIRIGKEYIPALLVIVLIDAVSIHINTEAYAYHNAYNLKQFIGNILMLQGSVLYYLPGLSFVPFGSARPLWTLALEWWFYLIFARFFISLKKKQELGFGSIIFLGICLAMPIEYIIGGRGNGLGFVFALGSLAYYCYDRINARAARFLFVGSIFLYMIYGCFLQDAYTIYSFIILWLCLCSGLKCFSIGTVKARNRVLAFLSGSTFMLYLTHWSFILMLQQLHLPIGNILYFFISVLLSLILSFVLYYIFGKKELLFKISVIFR